MTNISCNVTLPPEKMNIVVLASGTTGIFSSLCCVVAVSVVIILRLHVHFIYRLAVYQVLGSMSFCVTGGLTLMLYGYDKDVPYYEVSCKLTALFFTYSALVKILFTLWLVFHLFSYVVFFKNLKRLEWLYISSSVLGPLLVVWIPFIHNAYGLAGAWCTIRIWKDGCATEKFIEGIVEQFTFFYGPSIIMVGVGLVAIIIMVSVLLYRAHCSSGDDETLLLDGGQRKEVIKQLLPLLAYPVIFLFIISFPLASRIYSAVSANTNFYYLLVHMVILQLTGFFSSMALVAHLCSIQRYKHKKRKREDTTNFNAHTMEASSVMTSYH